MLLQLGTDSDTLMMEIFEMASTVRGFHVYHSVWTPFIGEQLNTTLEPNNIADKFAVAAIRSESDIVVGHIPREISKVVFFFLKHGGKVECIVTDDKRYYSEVAGGMEIQCFLRFIGNPLLVQRLRKVL